MWRDGQLQTTFYDFVLQPFYDEQGSILGVIEVAVEVTEQVLARQQIEEQDQQTKQLNQELAAANEELQAANEEVRHSNVELFRDQLSLRELNQELEVRVRERTQALRQAQSETERQRARLERFLMQVPAAICVLDGPELVYELVNPVYQQLFPGRVLQGRPLLEALPELTDQPVWHTLRQVYETGETHEEVEAHIAAARHENGPLESFYFHYIQQARYDEQGKIDGVLVFTFDVTEQVLARQHVQELNAALAALNEKLQATNEDLGNSNQQLMRTNVDLDNFIYTASHDLKAPISNIEGLLQALIHELPTQQSKAGEVSYILDLMQESVERFKRTIEHLTDVTKLQKEHAQPIADINLADIVEQVRLDLVPLLHATEGKLEVDVYRCAPIAFSEKNLRSVVYNLLSNALKYRHPARPARVRVRCYPEGDYQVLTVQDNGLGLDLNRERALFQMFQRYHTHVEGSGIGLFMVKKMVENAGGSIEVQSQLGQGSTFLVYFKR